MLHFFPSAFSVSTDISSSKLLSNITSAPDVMHNSPKSKFFANAYKSSFSFIFIFASKLEPITFSALLVSMLIFEKSLIFFNFSHLSNKISFFQSLGTSANFSRCILSSLSLFINLKISSVVKDNIGANHFNRQSRIIFRTKVQLFLF